MTTINFYKNDDIGIRVRFKDQSGSAIDITDYKLYFSVVADKDYSEYSDALISQSVGDGLDLEHADPTNGNTLIRIQESATDIPPGMYFYKLKIQDDEGFDITVTTGKFIINNYGESPQSGAGFIVTVGESTATVNIVLGDRIICGTGSGGVWGSITGTLSNQTDLTQYIAEQIGAIELTPGPAGTDGAKGDKGDTGAPGPNEVTTATDTNITGVLVGAEGKVKQGMPGTDFAAASHGHSGTYEPANANIQSHISSTSNPHSVDKSDVGLSSVQNINWCDYVSMSTNSITITDDHKGKTIWTTSASAVSAAVASDLGMDFVCGVIQGGAGQVAFSGLGDVTIENQNDHTKTAGLRAAATLRILPDGTCKLIGETA